MMDLYTSVAFQASKNLTNAYSTSFGLASRMLGSVIRPHIYNIYGLVRIADEIVDTYKGPDARKLLDDLELSVYEAVETGYSANIIIHAYATTARTFAIDNRLMESFFESMRMDSTHVKKFNQKTYETYIYGSAEVVGLMCLQVFCDNDTRLYQSLESGAKALGSAFQKINFIRDMAADHAQLGRYYFPVGTFETFDEVTKLEILADIAQDLTVARASLISLPRSSRVAVGAAYNSYAALLQALAKTPAEKLTLQRLRISNIHKIYGIILAWLGKYQKVNI